MAVRVGVVGLGYIGLPLLSAFASRGQQVVGLDIDPLHVTRLAAGEPNQIYEPGVAEILAVQGSLITFTTSYVELVSRADTIFVTVGTPYSPQGGADLSQIDGVVTGLAAVLRPGLTICLKSTVPPGTTRMVTRRLEELSGLREGIDFWVAFCPERTMEGRALEELLSLPNIVGGVSREASDRTAEVMRLLSGHVVVVDSPEVAEVCKLVDNSYRALAIAFANEVGEICEHLGIDQHAVRDAVMEGYSRAQLFKAGLGAGGPCLSKDPPVLAATAKQLGVDVPLLAASVASNVTVTEAIVERIKQFAHSLPGSSIRVALLGLAFKGHPETNDIRGGPAELIVRNLKEAFGERIDFGLYDPVVQEFDGRRPGSLRDAVTGANVVAVLTDHPALQGIPSSEILDTTARPLLVVDAWHGLSDPDRVISAGGVLIRPGDGRITRR